MKKRILSIVMMLALALSLVVGTALMANAEATKGDALGISANLADSVTVQVTFNLKYDSEFSEATATVGAKEPVDLTADVYADADGYVVVPVDVAVKDIDKAISVTVYDEEYTDFTKDSFTAKSYLESLASDMEFGGISTALINYGATAKKYFEGEALTAPASPDFTGYESEFNPTGSVSGISHRSVTLLLEEKTTIRYYFTLESGSDITAYTFTVAGEAQEPTELDGLYYVEKTGITPLELADAFEVTVTDGTSTYSCRYAAMDYVQRAFTGTATDARKAISAEIYNYFVAAMTIPECVAITYNTNGGEITSADYSAKIVEGSSDATLPTAFKKDAVFTGWYFDAACSDLATSAKLAEKTEDVTLYAGFASILQQTENATRYNQSATDPLMISDALAENGDVLTFSLDIKSLTTADSWVDIRANADGEYKKLELIATAANGTVYSSGYAKAIANIGETKKGIFDIVVTFDFDAGEATLVYYLDGEYLHTQVSTNISSRENYNIDYADTFWRYMLAADSEHTFTIYSGAYVTPATAPTSNINYNVNGGTLAGEGYSTTYTMGNEAITLPAATKDGALFSGWFFDSACTEKATPEAIAKNVTDITLFAGYANILETSEDRTIYDHSAGDKMLLGDALAKNGGYMTFSMQFNAPGTTDAWIRFRDNTGANQLDIIQVGSTGKKLTDINGKTLILFDETKTTGRIDIVVHYDFENGARTFDFYADGAYVSTHNAALTGTPSAWNYGADVMDNTSFWRYHLETSFDGSVTIYDGVYVAPAAE